MPIYLVFLSIFFIFPLFFLWIFYWRLLLRYKKTFLLTIIPTFLFGVPWDMLSVVTGLWRYDYSPTLGIWFSVLPLEEYLFTLLFPVFVVTLVIIIKYHLKKYV